MKSPARRGQLSLWRRQAAWCRQRLVTSTDGTLRLLALVASKDREAAADTVPVVHQQQLRGCLALGLQHSRPQAERWRCQRRWAGMSMLSTCSLQGRLARHGHGPTCKAQLRDRTFIAVRPSTAQNTSVMGGSGWVCVMLNRHALAPGASKKPAAPRPAEPAAHMGCTVHRAALRQHLAWSGWCAGGAASRRGPPGLAPGPAEGCASRSGWAACAPQGRSA